MTSKEIELSVGEMIKRYNAVSSRCLHDFENTRETFIELFGIIPNTYYITNPIDYQKTLENLKNTFDCYFPEYTVTYHINSERKEEKIEDFGEYVVFDDSKEGISNLKSILAVNSNYITIMTVCEYETIKPYIVFDEEKPSSEVFWVTRGQNGFISKRLTIEETTFDVKTHYNDDFNYQKIVDFIEDDKAGMVILYGEPGTGKTCLIRNLALTHPDKTFYFMDKSTFAYIMDPSFIDFLSDAENSVFVLEDCEGLLMDRVTSGNELMSTILNLSDGILGDGMKIKFLCTFNSNLTNIDKAILRKGRLKYKYEFKKLTAKKTEELAILLDKNIPSGKELTVCDIYNWDEDNNVQERKPSIGFGR